MVLILQTYTIFRITKINFYVYVKSFVGTLMHFTKKFKLPILGNRAESKKNQEYYILELETLRKKLPTYFFVCNQQWKFSWSEQKMELNKKHLNLYNAYWSKN